MKRIVASISLLTLLCVMLAGCGCKHVYECEVIDLPGCETAGKGRFTCNKCGDTYEGELEATGHDLFTSTVLEATCEDGLEIKSCVNCGYTEEIAVPAVGHNYIESSLTEDEKGNATVIYVCMFCGAESTEAYTTGN